MTDRRSGHAAFINEIGEVLKRHRWIAGLTVASPTDASRINCPEGYIPQEITIPTTGGGTTTTYVCVPADNT